MIPILYDETDKIEDVFVHEPGLECRIALEAECPSMWLFDPALKGANSLEWIMHAKKEHQEYVKLVKKQGAKVHYLTALLNQSKPILKQQIEKALKSGIAQKLIPKESAEQYWKEVKLDPVSAVLKGIKAKFEDYAKMAEAGFSILIPKPNAYFTQDPFAIIGNHFVKLNPATWQRSGEPDLWEMALQPVPEKFYQMEGISEGGDITIVKGKVFVGIGTRTEAYAAQELYKHKEKFDCIDDVIFVYKPDSGKEMGLNHSTELPFIHQDTIWMPLSSQTCHNLGNLQLMEACYVWYFDNNGGQISTLKDYVTSHQGGIVPANEKEQYSLAPNVLHVNGAVICADVNIETNKTLARYGFKVKTFNAKALLGGAGSGHCMSNAANYVVV